MGPKLILGRSGAMGHDLPGHPETAARALAIEKALAKANLTQETSGGLVRDVSRGSGRTEDEVRDTILAVHSPALFGGMRKLSADLAPDGVMNLDIDTYATPTSLADLVKAVSVVCDLVDEVVASSSASSSSTPPSGFGLVRPPGHHAVPSGPMGFCIFNTVSAAVRYAQRAHGFRRVTVFDFDVHHGNGTQDIFYDDPDVQYLSTHQEGAFPGTGKTWELGGEGAVGATLNVPLPPGSGHEAALLSWEAIVDPAIRRHRPEIIFVSAGFDAHWKDPQAGCQYQSSTFHALSKRIRALAEEVAECGGRVVYVLEGGYDLGALGDSVAEACRGLVGLPSDPREDTDALYDPPSKRIEEAIEAASERARDFL